jgi:hypothetical protein
MSDSEEMSLDEARGHFSQLLRRFRSDRRREEFLLWISLEFKNASPGMFHMRLILLKLLINR